MKTWRFSTLSNSTKMGALRVKASTMIPASRDLTYSSKAPQSKWTANLPWAPGRREISPLPLVKLEEP